MKDKNSKFGYIFAPAILLFSVYRILIRHQPGWWALLIFGLIILLIALIAPSKLSSFRIGWEKFGYMMGRVNTYVVLTIFYLLILTPLGLLMRLLGKDILQLKWEPKRSTYWDMHPPTTDSRMEEQF